MIPLNEVAKTLLDEHGNLRRLAEGVRDALALPEKADATAILVIRLCALAQAFEQHNAHEESLLSSILYDIDAWGPSRRARMDELHLAAHARIREAVYTAASSGDFASAASAAAGALASLLEHMDEEERDFLNAGVLRDDELVVDQSCG